jgi:ABC-2 type transport system ATP-binding protein
VLQECELNPLLTVKETMNLYSSFFPEPRDVDETLRLVGLDDRPGVRVGSLSGGQQRRLDVGVGIIGNPELLFLDEPTTGFDPTARRDAWNMIEGLKDLGTTIVLTTHYMEEAQHLADRVVILREGEIVAQGPPATLGDQLGRETMIRFRLTDGLTSDRLASALGRRPEVSGNEASLASTDPQRDLTGLLRWAESEGVRLADLEVRRPSLEDVFLEVTGDGAAEGTSK